MKFLIFTLLATLYFGASAVRADDVALARSRYAAVDKAVSKIKPVTRDLENYSLEGGWLVAYLQKGVPVKMVVRQFGETYKTNDELYFWQGRLFFVLETNERYNHSIADPDTPLEVVSREKNRYYFVNGKLWRWINGESKTIESGAEFKSQEKEQLSFAREMLAGARGKSEVIEAPKGSGMN